MKFNLTGLLAGLLFGGLLAGATLHEYDTIHASPPCQAYIQRNKNLETRHPKLIEPVRERLQEWGGVYGIENVLPEVLVTPIRICGTALGLGVIRQRFC